MSFDKIQSKTTQILAGAAMALVLVLPTCYAADVRNDAGSGTWKVGTEIDALPYATGGYYGSAFVGHNGWRYRGVAARATVPSFMVTDGFKDKRTDAYAVLVDRFFGAKRQKLEGFWIGGGGEYWRNRIRTEESPEYSHYNNFILTAGGGYVWKFSRHFYLNPWAGGHFVVGGSRNIQVSGKTYEQRLFTPEASIKVGVTF
jgi:hypothetical protein